MESSIGYNISQQRDSDQSVIILPIGHIQRSPNPKSNMTDINELNNIKMDLTNSNIDKLNLTENKSIKKQFPNNYKVIWSGEQEKINKYNKRQNRRFGLTSDKFFNIGDTKWVDWLISWLKWSIFKRIISIKEIKYCTYSDISNHWVLHVPNEYDYELSSEFRDEFLLELLIAREKLADDRVKFFIMKSEADLSKYSKTDTEKTMKQPTSVTPLEFSPEEFKEFYNRRNLVNKKEAEESQSLISRDNQILTIQDFEIVNVLGQGAFGQVVLVKKKDNGELFAMKILRKYDCILEEDNNGCKIFSSKFYHKFC